jgi:hypothetical protein
MPVLRAFSLSTDPVKWFKKEGLKSGSAGQIFVHLSVIISGLNTIVFYHFYDHRS